MNFENIFITLFLFLINDGDRRFLLILINGGGFGVVFKMKGGFEISKNPLISVIKEIKDINL